MSTRAVIRFGRLTTVYDDRWREVLDVLGRARVERASEVEFDHATGEWIATHIATGKVIARGRNRGEVIDREVTWLESLL